MSAALPLFPDLLELADPMKRWVDYEKRGHAVWCIDNLPSKAISDDLSELTCLAVIYDTERWLTAEYRTGKHWAVEIKHHFYEYVTVETGWGSSRQKERKLRYYARIHEKRFDSREGAIEFAERVKAIFERMKAGLDEPTEQLDNVSNIKVTACDMGADEADSSDDASAGVHADSCDRASMGEA